MNTKTHTKLSLVTLCDKWLLCSYKRLKEKKKKQQNPPKKPKKLPLELKSFI